MAVREARNAIKIEGWRLSRVPISSAQVIMQGDMLAWDAGNRVALPIVVSGGPSGAAFLGVADHTNPIQSIGMLTADTGETRMNVVQQGLVEMIAEVAETYFPWDTLIVGASAQHVKKGATNPVGFADPAVGAAGKAYAAGDLVLMWLKVPDAFRAFF